MPLLPPYPRLGPARGITLTVRLVLTGTAACALLSGPLLRAQSAVTGGSQTRSTEIAPPAIPALPPGPAPFSPDDPALQPLAEYTLPAPKQPLPASEARLDQVFTIAATDSAEMREQNYMVAQHDASRFRSWMRNLPEVTATYNVGVYDSTQNNAGGSSVVLGAGYTLQANYPLFDWGATAATNELGLLQEGIAKTDAMLAYVKLLQDIRQRYLDLIVQKAHAALLAGELESAARRYQLAQSLNDQRRNTTADLDRAASAYENLALQQSAAADKLTSQLGEFRRITGDRTFTAGDVPDHVYVPVVNQDDLKTKNDDFQKKGFDQSYAARDAGLNESAIDQQITINDARLKPKFSLSAGVSQAPYQNSTNNGLQFTTIFFTGISGTWKIFDRYDTVEDKLALLAERSLVETKLTNNRDKAYDDATDSAGKMALGLRSEAFYRRQFIQRQDAYRQLQVPFSTGRVDQLAVDSARDDLLETKFQILTQQAEIARGYYGFLSAIYQDPALAHAPAFTQTK